jgi:4-amino-4-deoxy-L-arabinose transferase-like glycosyltransferase
MTFLTMPQTRPGRFLAAALLLGLVVRVGALWATRDLGTEIVDEQHYTQIATSILDGHGFAWGPGRPTSIRPPLYPGLLAVIFSVTGPMNLQPVRVLQILMALATVALVYQLGRRVFNDSIACYAAGIFWLYPSLVFFNFTILTETLFTFLLVAFVLTAVIVVQRPRWGTALLCGVTLGLAALTRSVLWPLPLVLCPLIALLVRAPMATRLAMPALVLAGYAVTVGPWAVRNTKLQHVFTVVDTMGGGNFRMGNYEHTPDERMWAAVELTGEKNWSYALSQEFPGREFTEGEKEKWAQKKAVEYMLAHPGTTARRAAIKFGDFWGLEREFIAGVQKGMYTPPFWLAMIAAALTIGVYVAIALLGGAGVWLARPEWRTHVILLLPIVAIMGVHMLAFGHSRYHLPLMPILILYASALVWTRPRLSWRTAGLPLLGAAASVTLLAFVWVHQVILSDASRIKAFFGHGS